ncbi:hypothetical protein Hypma_009466 [Hypsizygus marmoreus]|uniref:Uncharacterized protein n=1 Tax=Hypsizygus marmoreus TaxID=39966 RepID=A0A369JVQ5_HYPMA|nr:hypothetical protein Hypma_009466 [Hypsizygus marmoreus]
MHIRWSNALTQSPHHGHYGAAIAFCSVLGADSTAHTPSMHYVRCHIAFMTTTQVSSLSPSPCCCTLPLH